MRSTNRERGLPGIRLASALLLVAGLAAAGCSSDEATAPTQPRNQVPNNPVPTGATAWSLQVTATPNEIEVAGTQVDAFVGVSVRQAANGALAPNGASVILTTTLGSFVVTDATGAESLARSAVLNTRSGQVSTILRFAGSEIGTAVIQAQLEQSFGQGLIELREPPVEPEPEPPAPFFIAGVEPNIGDPGGGQTRVFGSGFDEPIRVLIGDRPATVLGFSPEILTIEVPPIDLPVGQTAIVPVTVTINLNDTDPDAVQQTDTLQNAFTYARGAGGGGVAQPRIFSLSPRSGPNEGGTQVVINGEGFSNQVQVFFSGNSTIEAPVTSATSNRIVVTTPAATGSNGVNLNSIVAVQVINVDSGFQTTLPNGFQYGDGQGGGGMFISSAGPTQGPYTGGTTVTIFGSGFEEPVAVGFGGFAQQRISVTGTEIIARSVRVQLESCQSVSGPFSVTNVNTGSGVTSDLEFTYLPVMVTIGGIAPDLVDTDDNGFLLPASPTRTVISGVTGFDTLDAPSVFFGDSLAFNPDFDPAARTMTVDIPPFAGDFEEEPCIVGGVDGTQLAPTRVSVRVVNNQTGCEIELPSRFTYRPMTTCTPTMQPDPVIVSLSPNAGTSAGGTGVTISGLNFRSPARVTFGGVPAPSATVAGSTSISTTTPAFLGPFTTVACDDDMDGTVGARNQPTAVSVSVTNLSDGSTDTLANAFTFTPVDTSCVGD